MAEVRSEVTQAKRLSSNKTIIIAAALIIAIITFVVFLPTLQNDFLIWDDDILVTKNLHIRSLGLDTVKWAFTNVSLTAFGTATILASSFDDGSFDNCGVDSIGVSRDGINFIICSGLRIEISQVRNVLPG